MFFFAIIMLMASFSMIKNQKETGTVSKKTSLLQNVYPRIYKRNKTQKKLRFFHINNGGLYYLQRN